MDRAAASASIGAALDVALGGPPPPRKNPTMELTGDDVQVVGGNAPRIPPPVVAVSPPPQAVPAPPQRKRRRRATPAGPVEIPKDIKPIPRPRRPSMEEPLATASLYDGDVLYDDSKVMPQAYRAQQPASVPVVDVEIDGDESMQPRSGGMGKWIILVALLLATVIVGGGFLYADHRRDAQVRERRLQEREEAIRRMQEHAAPPGTASTP
jgi:hypothetical protein